MIARAYCLLLFLCASAALLAFPHKTEAAITFGNVTSQGFHCGSEVNCTNLDEVTAFSAPTISGSNAVLLIGVSLNGSGEDVPDFVTYDGVDLGAADFDSGVVSSTRTLVWVVTNPASAKLVDMQVGPNGQNGVITAAYYTGVNQATPYRTVTTGTGTANPGTVAVTNSQTNDLIAGFFSINDTSAANGLTEARVGAGQTHRLTTVNSSAESQLAFSDEPGASGSVTHSWDFVNDGNNGWAGVAIPLIPSGGGVLIKPPNNLGLVGYWSFNEGTSTVATDFSGNGNTGLLISSWVNGKRGKAILFDGSGADVTVQDNASLDISGSFTLSLWYKPTSLPIGDTDGLITKDAGNASNYFLVIGENDPVCGFYAAGAYQVHQNTNVNLQAGTWYHISCSFDDAGNTVKMYVNNVEVVNEAENNSPTPNSTILSIGSSQPASATENADGTMDEVRIYSRALGAAEVAKLYGSGAVKFTSNSKTLTRGSSLEQGLVGLWTFDGGDTTWTSASAGTTRDGSGNNNTGTLTNMNQNTSVNGGKLGQALNFNGSSNYVRINSVADDVQTGAATVSLWFKPASTFSAANTVDQTIFSISDANSNNDLRFRLRQADGFLSWQTVSLFTVDDSVSSISSWQANTWYHIVGTISADGSAKVLYVNGVEENLTTGLSARGGTLSTEATIGVLDNLTEYFNGAIDDVRVYNRALSPAEIQQLYKLGTVIIRP